jgi:integrase/recombinase XerD
MEIEKTTNNHPALLSKCPKYTREIALFASWLKDKKMDISRDSVEGYLRYLKDRDYAPRSYNLKLTAIKEAIRWMFKVNGESFDLRKRVLIEEYLDSLKPFKIQSVAVTEERVLSKDEIDRLRKHTSKRLRLIIGFLYHTGLRISEMTAIKNDQLKENGKYWKIAIVGKGKKLREIKCRKELILDIKNVFQGKTYLFETHAYRNGKKGGRPLDRHNITKQIKIAGDKFIGKEISAHTLRHSFATHLIQDGKNIKAVSNYLGHSSVKTTLDLYVHDHLELDDLPL